MLERKVAYESKNIIRHDSFDAAVLACSTILPNAIVGSGKVISESRNVSGFSSIESQGSADVTITIGTTESVSIEADDNIVPLSTTVVSNGTLLIGNKAFTNTNTSGPIQVSVTMKSLRGISLSGSGSMNASGLAGQDLVVNLPGSGNITVTGAMNNLTISLPGSGNVYCKGLKARSATATLNGSGNIEVYASESLDANIRGSGTIRYEGTPALIKKNVTGSGAITP